jgi:hypothetical protein
MNQEVLEATIWEMCKRANNYLKTAKESLDEAQNVVNTIKGLMLEQEKQKNESKL